MITQTSDVPGTRSPACQLQTTTQIEICNFLLFPAQRATCEGLYEGPLIAGPPKLLQINSLSSFSHFLSKRKTSRENLPPGKHLT